MTVVQDEDTEMKEDPVVPQAPGQTPTNNLAAHGSEMKTVTQNAELIPNHTWYLISMEWWKKWEQFTEGVEGCSSPGPINNSSLMDEDSATLRPDLMDETDYKLVPERVWKELEQRFEVADSERDTIGRTVIEQGNSCTIEVYPLHLTLVIADEEAIKRATGAFKDDSDGFFAPRTDNTKSKRIVISRAQTLDALTKEVRTFVDEAQKKCVVTAARLFAFHEAEKSFELLDEEKDVALADLVEPNQRIFVDVFRPSFIDLSERQRKASDSANKTATTSDNDAVRKPLFGGSNALLGTVPKWLLLMKVHETEKRFTQIYPTTVSYYWSSGSSDGVIYAFQLPSVPIEERPVTVFFTQRRPTTGGLGKIKSRDYETIGLPFVARFPWAECTYENLNNWAMNRIQSLFARMPDGDAEWSSDEEEEKEGGLRPEDVERRPNKDDDNDSGCGNEENGNSRDATEQVDVAVSSDRSRYVSLSLCDSLNARHTTTRPLLSATSAEGAAEVVLTAEGRLKYGTDGMDAFSVAVDWTPAFYRCCFNQQFKDSVETVERQQDVKKALGLSDLFDLYTKEERLSDKDPWYCPKCKEHRQATKKLDVFKLPNILIIQLKRFCYGSIYRNKIETLVEFPIEGLDMSEFIRHPDADVGASSIYDLVAVSNHMGGLGGGHYTAYAKNYRDGHWYHFDDSHVSAAGSHGIVSKSAYVLFYQRRGSFVPSQVEAHIEPNIEEETMEE